MNDQGSEERSRAMIIIGCDFHTRYQQIAMMDEVGDLLYQKVRFFPKSFGLRRPAERG
jgi:hypothetical protein